MIATFFKNELVLWKLGSRLALQIRQKRLRLEAFATRKCATCCYG